MAICGEVKKIGGEALKRKPLPLVWLVGLLVVVALISLMVTNVNDFRQSAGWFLFGLFVLGIALALAASVEPDNRGKVWGELGRSLLVAGLMSFAVWLIGDLRRPAEAHHALQMTLGVQREMPGVDLHGENLSQFDLAEKNLEGANLADADLTATSLVRTNLSGADLSSADLSGANLEEADLRGTDLANANLVGVEASLVDLRDAKLFGADLSEAQLSGAKLQRVCLADASLADAYLPDAHLERAALTAADLQGAKFYFDLRGAHLAAIGLDGAKNPADARWPPGFEQRVEALADPSSSSKPAVSRAPARGTGAGTVLAVPDGDTLLLATANGRKAVRLIGVDAPDLDEPGGIPARDLLRHLLPKGTRVRFAYDERRSDGFERDLLYVYGTHGRLVNEKMLQRGVVVASIDPPSDRLRNARYARQFVAAESWARRHALGLWQTCPP